MHTLEPVRTPRRSPRRHPGSTGNRQTNQLSPSRGDIQRQLFDKQPSEESAANTRSASSSLSSRECDRRALSTGELSSPEKYPPPPSPLQQLSFSKPPSPEKGRRNASIHTSSEATGPLSTNAPSTFPLECSTQPFSTLLKHTSPIPRSAQTTRVPSIYTQATRVPLPSPIASQRPSTIVSLQPLPEHEPGALLVPNSEGQSARESIVTDSAPQNTHHPRNDLNAPEAPVDIEKEKDLQRLYVHLHRITVHQQKSIAAAFGVAQIGNKKVRAARIFVVISGMMERKSWSAIEALCDKARERGKDFKPDYDRTIETWNATFENTIVPPVAELEALSGVRQHPRSPRSRDILIADESDDDGDHVLQNEPVASSITLEEFARLLLVFRDNREAEMDLRRSGQDMTTAQLDVSTNRHAFWTERIEGIFNESQHLTNERLVCPISHIDPGRPVTCFRSGSALQGLFTKFRKEFTVAHGKWNVSGNNDHMTFKNYCRLQGRTTLSRSGARCLIAWQIFKFCTPEQNNLLLDFCTKAMSEAAGAQLESGIAPNGEFGVTYRKRRTRPSQDSLNDSTGEALVDALRSFSKREGEEEPLSKKKKAELVDLSVINARQENQRKLVNSLVEALQLVEANEGKQDQKFKHILQKYYKSLTNRLEKELEHDVQ